MTTVQRSGWRRLAAEGVGTFFLVLVAAGAGVIDVVTDGQVGRPAAAIAPGLMVLALIYTLGETSGAHLNPAVTLAFAARGHFPWRRVPAYVAAQLVGALAAAGLLRGLFGTAGQVGASRPWPGIGSGTAFALETVLSFGLMTVILGTSSGARNIGHNAAIAIGGYIALAALWAGPATGASMNPARSLAPVLAGGHGGPLWIYLLGPLLGAALAVPFARVLRGPPSTEATHAAQGRPDMTEQGGERPPDPAAGPGGSGPPAR
ncbi:MIP/aquaporin family protein [Kitasatospora sp. NPDC091207]|uniref:MIP/aquaporin family protein n=1 Tax=Kitasatospora sp. NPDC091207 TaxID=3364083 RepID=UPI003828E9CF